MSLESAATRTSDKVAIYVQRRGRLNTNAVVSLLLVLLVVTLGDQAAKKAAGVRKKASAQAAVSLKTFSDEVAKSTAKSPQQQIRDRCSATRSLKIRHVCTIMEIQATESLQALGGKGAKRCNRNFKTNFRNFKPNIATSIFKFRNCKLKLHK